VHVSFSMPGDLSRVMLHVGVLLSSRWRALRVAVPHRCADTTERVLTECGIPFTAGRLKMAHEVNDAVQLPALRAFLQGPEADK
jgi:hypothetical protein